MNLLTRNVFAPLILGVLISGCASKQALIEEKDFLIEDQRARLESCETNLLEKEEQLAALKRQMNSEKMRAEDALNQCREQLTKVELEDQDLIAREKELREKLAGDISQKNVEIERLKDRLAVRVLDKVLFKSGSVEILPEGQAVLSRIASSVGDTDEALRIEGHTDNVPIGPRLVARIPTNWELSVLRAASVVRYLEGQEIASTRMTAAGHSKFKPIAENDSDENRQLNRRVEILLFPGGGGN